MSLVTLLETAQTLTEVAPSLSYSEAIRVIQNEQRNMLLEKQNDFLKKISEQLQPLELNQYSLNNKTFYN